MLVAFPKNYCYLFLFSCLRWRSAIGVSSGKLQQELSCLRFLVALRSTEAGGGRV